MRVFDDELEVGFYVKVWKGKPKSQEFVRALVLDIQQAIDHRTGNGAAAALAPVKAVELPPPTRRAGELPVYVSGRCADGTVEHVDHQIYHQTMEAMDAVGWLVKPAANRLVIGYDTLRQRLYAYAKKGLVVKVGKDQWRRA